MRRATAIAALLCTFALIASAQQTPQTVQEREKERTKTKTRTLSSSVKRPPAATKRPKFTGSAIQVMEFKPADIAVPAQFEMAMYENTIEQLEKAGRFKTIYRDGDKRAAAGEPDLVVMKCTIWEFKEGSARQRQVTTVSGKTSIHVHVHIEDAKGEPLVDKDVEGKVQLLGENMRATFDLAKNISALVNQNF